MALATLCVDTCIFIDIADADPSFGESSAHCLAIQQKHSELVICPVSYVELAPVFDGQRKLFDEFLRGLGVRQDRSFDDEDWHRAFAAWAKYVSARRAGQMNKRPIADVLIGAFAASRDGLITRNTADFRRLFPRLKLVEPASLKQPA